MAAAAAAAQGEAEFKFRLRTAGRGVRSPLPQPGGATGPGRSPLPAAGERGVFRVRSAECRVQCSESDCLRTVDRLVDSCGQLERVVDRSVVDSLVRTVVDREFVYTVYARPAECQTGRAGGKTTAASYLPSCSGMRSSAVRCITGWCSALQYCLCFVKCTAVQGCSVKCSAVYCSVVDLPAGGTVQLW